MQELESNLDNLFKKAAENYPLRTGKDDWAEIVVPKLNEGAVLAGIERSFFKKGISFLILTFSLLPLVLFDTNAIGSKSLSENVVRQPLEKAANVIIGNKEQVATGVVKIAGSSNRHPLTSNPEKNLLHPDNYSVARSKNGIVNSQLPELVVSKDSTAISKLMSREDKQTDRISEGETIQKNDITQNRGVDTMSQIPVDLIVNTRKQHGFYWGAVLGPSFNNIKNQRLKKPGYDFGLVAGYSFNKKLSVEACLLFEKKYYFSDGKYFNMAKAGASMPAGMKIISLDGSFSVFEVPIKLRYNLAGNNTRHFYITSGISTYIVTNEYNKYNTVTNGIQENVTGDYNNMSPYAAAVFNAGFGFDNSVGKNNRVRIEPYIQVPLKGIGIGSLRVRTIGLHFGLLRAKN